MLCQSFGDPNLKIDDRGFDSGNCHGIQNDLRDMGDQSILAEFGLGNIVLVTLPEKHNYFVGMGVNAHAIACRKVS